MGKFTQSHRCRYSPRHVDVASSVRGICFKKRLLVNIALNLCQSDQKIDIILSAYGHLTNSLSVYMNPANHELHAANRLHT